MDIESYLDELLAGGALPEPEEGEDPALDKLRRVLAQSGRDRQDVLRQRRAFEELATALMQLAQLDFDISLNADHDDDIVNATVVGLSMMAEELAHAHGELKHARDAALAASRSKSTFLANMSHELRTPLNAIIGYCELLIDDCTVEPALEGALEDLERILSAGRHLLNLISDVLDLSKIEAGRLEVDLQRTRLGVIATEVIDALRPNAEVKGLHLALNIESDPEVNADPLRMKQAMFNLVGNAIKFTNEGEVEVVLRGESRMVQLSVRDTGIGIDADRLAAVFEPFTQADRSTTRNFGGTGLGLAISRQLVRMMGGDLVASSVRDEGSEFLIELPEAKVEIIGPTGETRLPTLLLVDDDPTFHHLVRRQLVDLECDILSATDGEQALAMVDERRPDLVILDIVMPTLDGWGTLTRLKATPELADIPVVMVSVWDQSHSASPLRATDFLVKPVSRSALVRTVTRYLRPGGRTVLVVDDDRETRELVRRLLQRSGCSVVEAQDGEMALRRARVERPDLVLMDLQMPNMDGFACTAAFREDPELAEVPIVVLTAMDLTLQERTDLAGHVDHVLQKGQGATALLGAIREALGLL